jgi:RimJ/RimL family protein N-acetyltransferase
MFIKNIILNGAYSQAFLFLIKPVIMHLTIRPWQNNDLQPLVALANNKKIFDNVRDYFPHPYTLKDAEDWLALNEGITPALNFAIEVDGRLAGSIGMVPKQDVNRCNMEIGYWLGEPYWNKGIASKAIELMVELIWNIHHHINRIYAEVFEHNKASMEALKKNGFVLESIRKKGVIKNNVMLDDYVWVKFRNK